MRATICVAVDKATERTAVEAWFARWRSELPFVSENRGCGCCVDISDVEGSSEALSELPVEVLARSEWTDFRDLGTTE